LSGFSVEAAAALGGPGWLRSLRESAAERFASRPLPTEADEIWRYSRISELDLGSYAAVPFTAGEPSDQARPNHVVATLDAIGPHAAVAFVRNGRVIATEVNPALAAKGLVVADIATLADGDDILGSVAAGDSTDVFTDLNLAFLTGAAVVQVPPGLVVEHPVVVVHWLDAEGSAVFPRTIVHAGANSEVTVVEQQGSSDVRAFVDPVVELHADDAARLRYVNVQDLGPRVFQIGYQASRVGRDSTCRSATVALGGDYARLRTDSRIEGKGGTSYLTAAYFADGTRMHDFRTLQDHAAPSSTSDLLFKGAVQDTGRSVYSGMIRVRKEARGTNAFQTNRNLVLSEGAGAESVPNLEIETDDVRCSHASAVGPIDEDQLYYLESRGVPPEMAERLIVLGFFGEVLDRIPAPGLVADIRLRLAARLATGGEK